MKLVLLLLAWSWTILGIWWFFRPGGIRRRLERRYRKGLRGLLVVVLVVSAGVLFSVARQLGGFGGILLAVLGIIALLKALFFLRGKLSDAVLDWWSGQPTWVYRTAAAVLFLLGCLLQVILRWGSPAQ